MRNDIRQTLTFTQERIKNMRTEMYIDREKRTEKERLLKTGGIILWVLMIGVSIILASQSLVAAG
ncbi:hypothetical protein D7V94_18015 [Parablautia intestinalis]|uniref:Uncharacterized protein n=1 Tax=Parablautia intestinalis TaxID=2320100 RepID=A0A3A9ADG4_9FIRM|nr:hypothetical protein [Parablautia intestinalis]RKI89499.1 hypothetical protein D7V94_18015 [Parablautia intestinalis]